MTESVISTIQRLVRELYQPFDGIVELARGFGEAALAVTESRSARIVLRNPEGGEDIHISVGEEGPCRGPLLRSCFPVRYQGSDLGFLEISASTRRRGSDEPACEWIARSLAYHAKRQEISLLARRRYGIELAFIGTSESLARVDRFVERASLAMPPALILGSHGSEVERIALALHLAGPRRDEAFVQVSCATFDSLTLEEKLHELLRKADRGTLLLIGVEELDLRSQKLLCHLLETGLESWTAARGGRPYAVRLVATAHQDLDEMVRAGDFCAPLLERLDFLRLEVEPLRNRREDIRPVLEYYLRQHTCGEVPEVSAEVVDACVEYDWPGDLSELSRVVARLVVMTEDGRVSPRHLHSYAPQILGRRHSPPAEKDSSSMHPSRLRACEACHPALCRAIDFISANHHRKLTLGEVAANAYVSSSHLAHLFQQYLGTSFVRYLTTLRVEQAKHLLSEKPWESISQIASTAGFSDLRTFERTFKNHLGCSPQAFRKVLRDRGNRYQSSLEPRRLA